MGFINQLITGGHHHVASCDPETQTRELPGRRQTDQKNIITFAHKHLGCLLKYPESYIFVWSGQWWSYSCFSWILPYNIFHGISYEFSMVVFPMNYHSLPIFSILFPWYFLWITHIFHHFPVLFPWKMGPFFSPGGPWGVPGNPRHPGVRRRWPVPLRSRPETWKGQWITEVCTYYIYILLYILYWWWWWWLLLLLLLSL